MLCKKLFASALTTAVMLGGAGAAYAQTNDDAASISALGGAKISLQQAISTAEQRIGGKAIDAHLNSENAVTTYAIELLKGDAVQIVLVDLGTGGVVSIGPADSQPGEGSERAGQESSD
jgi:uncharacterized membrane protein YkoI